MTILPLVLDRQPPYLRGASGCPSALLALCGFGLVIDRVRRAIKPLTDQPVNVVTMFDPDETYRTRLAAHGVKADSIAPLAGLDRLLARFEPSDWLLILDAAMQPTDLEDLGKLTEDRSEDFSARHLVFLERTTATPREYVQLDSERVVRRIQRYYPGITWLQARTVVASLVPASAVQQLAPQAVSSPAELRAALVTIGLVSRDIHADGGAIDLREEHGLLELCGRMLATADETAAAGGFEQVRPNVWAGTGCRIDPSARFHGPVVLHADATVEANATIIGPALVGAGSRVGHGAAVVRSIVLPNTPIAASAAIRHTVVSGNGLGNVRGDAARPVGSDSRTRLWLPALSAEPESAASRPARRRAGYSALKAVAEGIVALVGLLVISPLLLAAAAAVKLTSRGPIFFSHEREGRDGRAFRCWKFRTMVQNAHSLQRTLYKTNNVDGPQFKMDNDPRITRVGRWMRATNVDELPQLFNVLLGEMSLIGPRPSPFRENQICVPWRQARLSVRPGITGLWQICRNERASGDFHQWIYYDMLYVRHMSLWLDLKILAITVLTCGGRWSVPLTWLIPTHKLHESYDGVGAARPESATVEQRTAEGTAATATQAGDPKRVEEAA